MHGSFHGRTISMVSATGQARHREKFRPQMPGYRFVPFDDLSALECSLDAEVAAVIVEPIQGEGGVGIPSAGYLRAVSERCHANGSLLIVDEVQTGFGRTGPLFATAASGAQGVLLTMAKGIAGGFPPGAFALTEEVWPGWRPAITAVPTAATRSPARWPSPSSATCSRTTSRLTSQSSVARRSPRWPAGIRCIRESSPMCAAAASCSWSSSAMRQRPRRSPPHAFSRKVFVRQTQGRGIRVFPALNITREELMSGLATLREAIEVVAGGGLGE